jgi:hygromycin-B 7''-O-kinase
MDNTLSLESFNDRTTYSAHFMDPVFWQPYVHQVCQWNSLTCLEVTPGLPGTYPTFIVRLDSKAFPKPFGSHAGSLVVKFFGPPFGGPASFRIELALGRLLAGLSLPIPSPAILASGQLTSDWSYLIFEHVRGLSIGQVRDQLSSDDWQSVAIRMGEYMRCLHTLTPAHLPDLPPAIQPSWDGYASFLSRQRLNCLAHHRAWDDLPAHLLGQLEDFVLPVERLIDFSAPPHLVHGDLTADHLLGRLESGGWQTLSIIDWGDAMTGNLLYELVAVHLDLFRSDKRLLRLCLEAYGQPGFFRHDFPRQALSLTLLHQFPMPRSFYTPHQDAKTLSELAERLFIVSP